MLAPEIMSGFGCKAVNVSNSELSFCDWYPRLESPVYPTVFPITGVCVCVWGGEMTQPAPQL